MVSSWESRLQQQELEAWHGTGTPFFEVRHAVFTIQEEEGNAKHRYTVLCRITIDPYNLARLKSNEVLKYKVFANKNISNQYHQYYLSIELHVKILQC